MIRHNAPPLKVAPGVVVVEPRLGTGVVFETYRNGFAYVSFDNGPQLTVPVYGLTPQHPQS